jgi:hypothetical protein
MTGIAISYTCFAVETGVAEKRGVEKAVNDSRCKEHP